MRINQGLLSLEVRPDALAVAYNLNSSHPKIGLCELYPYSDNDQFKKSLEKVVSRHNLRKTKCTVTLHPDYYHLTLTDAPNTPQSEYKNAIRWQIKDIIDYPLDDIVIDIFYPGGNNDNKGKIYVIAAQNSFLQNIINTIQDCELHPIALDVREFAIRNLIANLAPPAETTGFLNIVNKKCLMVFVKQKKIQFVRSFTTINNLQDELSKELQRSFDYCQTELHQEIPTKILTPSTIELGVETIQSIAKSLNKEITVFDLQKIVNLGSGNQTIANDCWVAIGGALRNTI